MALQTVVGNKMPAQLAAALAETDEEAAEIEWRSASRTEAGGTDDELGFDAVASM